MSTTQPTRGRPTTGKLTSYQRSEIRKMRANGWEIGRVKRYANDENPWATIEIRKGSYSTVAAFPATKADERWMTEAGR